MEPEDACWERLQEALAGRQQEIAERWHRALRSGGDMPDSTAARQRFAELTARALALLLADPFDCEGARAIRADLVELGFGEPEALGQTVTMLGQELLPVSRPRRSSPSSRGCWPCSLSWPLTLPTGYSRRFRELPALWPWRRKTGCGWCSSRCR